MQKEGKLAAADSCGGDTGANGPPGTSQRSKGRFKLSLCGTEVGGRRTQVWESPLESLAGDTPHLKSSGRSSPEAILFHFPGQHLRLYLHFPSGSTH